MRVLPKLCLLCLLFLAAGWILSVLSCVGEAEDVEFPYVLQIRPESALFVYGHEFRGSVTLTWESGDSLRLEGLPVWPRPKPAVEPIPEERLRSIYGEVPFVLRLVDEGATWTEAAQEFASQEAHMQSDMARTYWVALEETGSGREAARVVLDSMDRTLLDPAFEPIAHERAVTFKFEGMPTDTYVDFGDTPPREMTAEEQEALEYERIQALAKRMTHTLSEMRGPWVMLISRSGTTVFGGEKASDALRQIEQMRRGESAEGPVNERHINLILDAERGGESE